MCGYRWFVLLTSFFWTTISLQGVHAAADEPRLAPPLLKPPGISHGYGYASPDEFSYRGPQRDDEFPEDMLSKSMCQVTTVISTEPKFGSQIDRPERKRHPETCPPRHMHATLAVSAREFHWQAPGTCHQPLYFEEINLERYGYSCIGEAQPILSAAHFFGTVPIMPYKMTVHRPCECIYTLGHYRPGSCVPHRTHWLPWRWDAAAVQLGAVTGLAFIP